MFKTMVFQILYPDAAARVHQVLSAIAASAEWKRYSSSFAEIAWVDGRNHFRKFFDALEGQSGEEWLGVMEWAVIEEMRRHGEHFGADLAASTNRVVERMSGHPNIEFAR